MPDYKIFEAGDVVLQSGLTYRNARLAYKTYGTLDAAVGISKDNWYASIYGSNLTDSHASMFTSSAQFIKFEVPLRPRVVALKLGAHF